ncbi:MAG TPA: hypothetical protein VFL86_29830, partial [Burkholderiaceae bacterium]|nr:hypothetical protein [Burkholderiaceae bacterium]
SLSRLPMNKSELLERLQSFQDRLRSDVISAYAQKGTSFGAERFAAWRRQFSKFLEGGLKSEVQRLDLSSVN